MLPASHMLQPKEWGEKISQTAIQRNEWPNIKRLQQRKAETDIGVISTGESTLHCDCHLPALHLPCLIDNFPKKLKYQFLLR